MMKSCFDDRCPLIGKLKLDLGSLKPLWQLHDSLSKEQTDGGSVVPPVLRALTELFLQVEATAMVMASVMVILVAKTKNIDQRGLDGYGHFLGILISLRRVALYDDITNN